MFFSSPPRLRRQAVRHFPSLIEELNQRIAGSIHSDPDPRVSLGIGQQQGGFAIVESHREYIEQHYLHGIVRAEVILTETGEPLKFDDGIKGGLFARARMFLDAKNPRIVQIWKPNGQASAT